jgi:hypothetical protein
MLEGVHRLEVFSRLIQKAKYHLGNDNIILATKQIAKLSKKLLEEQNFLREVNSFDFINNQVEETKLKISSSIEESVIQFLFIDNEAILKHRVEKLYNLYKKDFEGDVQENFDRRSISSDFAIMIKSTLLNRYLEFITGEYTMNRLKQVDCTLELIAKYEIERTSNLIISGGMEKLMVNTNANLNAQNISHLVLLVYCYSSINSLKQLNEVSVWVSVRKWLKWCRIICSV